MSFGEQLGERKEKETTSKIVLRFFRHSKRENAPEKANKDILLSQEGRDYAKSKAKTSTNLSQSVAFGSPRPRAQETAGFVMSGTRVDITGGESLDELRQKIDKDLLIGSKIGVDSRLDFNSNEDTPYQKAFYDAFRAGKYMQFIVNDSDALAHQMGDVDGDTYSRMASRIAKIIQKYLSIAPRWEQLASDPQQHYTDTLERFLCTHQGVAESFLAKVIERTKGVEERDRFVASLTKTNGFDFIEGFTVEIRNHVHASPDIHLSFNKNDGDVMFSFEAIISKSDIDAIAEGGE